MESSISSLGLSDLTPFRQWDDYGFIFGVAIKQGKLYTRPKEKRNKDWDEIKIEYVYDQFWCLVYFPIEGGYIECGYLKEPFDYQEFKKIVLNSSLKKHKRILKII